MPASHQPSARFRKAARAERTRLERARAEAQETIERLSSELEAARAHLAEISASLDAVHMMVGGPRAAPSEGAAAGGSDAVADSDQARALRGASIREVAIRTLLAGGRSRGPIHYREWLDLVEAEGWLVQGQRPDAVFLGQVARSPLVKSTTHAGFYELDFDAPARLRARIDETRARLNSVMEDRDAAATEEAEALVGDLKQLQRQLDEATKALSTDPNHAVSLDVAA